MSTAAAPTRLAMPARADLVSEAIARLDTAGLRSQLLALDSRTLADLGLRLTDRNWSVLEAVRWLNIELGHSPDDDMPSGGIDKNAVYRFAAHFRRLYAQVRAEHARRIARLSVEAACDGEIASMARVAQSRLMDLVAERLVETDNLEELTGSEMSAAIATVDAWARGQIKREELALKMAESERRARKLEADLQVTQARLAALGGRVKAAAEEARRDVRAAAADSRDGRLSVDEVYQALDRAMKGLPLDDLIESNPAPRGP